MDIIRATCILLLSLFSLQLIFLSANELIQLFKFSLLDEFSWSRYVVLGQSSDRKLKTIIQRIMT